MAMRMRPVPNDKENRVPLARKSANIPNNPLEEKKAPTTPRGLAARQATPAGANGRAAATGRAATPTRTGTGIASRGARKPPPTLKQQVEARKAEREALEAELESLEAEAIDVEAACLDAEQAAQECEREMIDRTAAISEEFAATDAEEQALEAELVEVNQALAVQRTRNAELSRRNVQLDRESATVQSALADAESELKRITRTHNELDAELERQEQNCEGIKVTAKKFSERCAADMVRIDAMRNRLMEVCGSEPSERLQSMLDDLAVRLEWAKETKLVCDQLHRDGPLGPSFEEDNELASQLKQSVEKVRKSCGRLSLTVWEAVDE